MVRCRMYLELYQSEDLLSQARGLGALLLEGLQELAAEFPSVFSNPSGDRPSLRHRSARHQCSRLLPREAFRQKTNYSPPLENAHSVFGLSSTCPSMMPRKGWRSFARSLPIVDVDDRSHQRVRSGRAANDVTCYT